MTGARARGHFYSSALGLLFHMRTGSGKKKAGTMLLLSWLSTFLTNNAVFAWARARFPSAFHHVFHNFSLFSALQRTITRIMGRPLDAKPAPGATDQKPPRRMVHLKTKEECRLGNETIQVWTLELPSKHAEGILKFVCLSAPH